MTSSAKQKTLNTYDPFYDKTVWFSVLSPLVELKGFEPFFLLECNSFKGSSYHAI